MSTVKAVAVITGDPTVRGNLQFVQDSQGATHIRGKISGLSPGLHGFHIHSLGDTTNGCNSTGPHFNPFEKDHGAPSDKERHAGDLGNIVAGPDGVAEIFIKDMLIPLRGQHSILGRAVVVHADPDDLGRGKGETLAAFIFSPNVISSFLLVCAVCGFKSGNCKVDMILARQQEMQVQESDVVSLGFNPRSSVNCSHIFHTIYLDTLYNHVRCLNPHIISQKLIIKFLHG
ncbi:unnamed protein product [Camellia sinensis]